MGLSYKIWSTCYHYYILCRTLVELKCGKHLGLFGFELGYPPCIYRWKWFAFTCLVEIRKSLPMCVKVVDVSQEDWNTINQSVLSLFKPFTWCFNSSFLFQPFILSLPYFKLPKSFKLLFTPSSTSLREPTYLNLLSL